VATLGELLGDLGAEGIEVVRLAAGDEALVDDDLLIDPFPAGVADVGLQGGRRRPAIGPGRTGPRRR